MVTGSIVFETVDREHMDGMANQILTHLSATRWRKPLLVVWAHEPLIYDQMTKWFGQP